MKIIKITSLGCTSCIIMNNIIKNYTSNKNVEVIEYDYDLDNNEIKKYNVGNILPLIILKDNERELRIIGEKTNKEFLDIISEFESGE